MSRIDTDTDTKGLGIGLFDTIPIFPSVSVIYYPPMQMHIRSISISKPMQSMYNFNGRIKITTTACWKIDWGKELPSLLF